MIQRIYFCTIGVRQYIEEYIGEYARYEYCEFAHYIRAANSGKAKSLFRNYMRTENPDIDFEWNEIKCRLATQEEQEEINFEECDKIT
jgi:GrpB-like predicted nucleotidyltransferase (UPF0157 family)